jgi:hypothetical protein
VWLAGLVIFLDMFRYLNALQMGKVKNEMKAGLAAVRGEDDRVEAPKVGADDESEEMVSAADIDGDFRDRFSLFVRIRTLLIHQRIRAHVVSGIEFMMFVFIIGPLIDEIVVTTLVSAGLLAGFEMLLVYKLWIATKAYTRKLAGVPKIPAPYTPAREASPSLPRR